jgi:hypothetical protein
MDHEMRAQENEFSVAEGRTFGCGNISKLYIDHIRFDAKKTPYS